MYAQLKQSLQALGQGNMFNLIKSVISIFLSCYIVIGWAEKVEHQVMLANTYQSQEVSGWLMSEKLDGVRGVWNGREMRSKNGNLYNAPIAFIKDFPDFALDGELYSRRGQFSHISGVVRAGKDWSELKYYVFDVPNEQGGLLQRLDKIKKWLKTNPNPNIVVIKQTKINNIGEAKQYLAEIEKAGGEGVILRDPNAFYVSKRTDTYLKLKTYQDDECTVIEHLQGRGKYQNKLGSIKCELANGEIIKIGSGFTDSERENPPPIGSVITYRYNGFTKNSKPRFIRFWRIRRDKSDDQ